MARMLRTKLRVPARVQQWGQPFRNIILDYYEVFTDIFKSARERRLRSMVGLIGAGAVVYLTKKVPDELSFHAELLDSANELSLVNETEQNRISKAYIEKTLDLYSHKRLKYVSLGVVAVILELPAYPDLKSYQQTCTHLQPRWWTFYQRIIDVGVYGRWVVLQQKMIDYDINDTDWIT